MSGKGDRAGTPCPLLLAGAMGGLVDRGANPRSSYRQSNAYLIKPPRRPGRLRDGQSTLSLDLASGAVPALDRRPPAGAPLAGNGSRAVDTLEVRGPDASG